MPQGPLAAPVDSATATAVETWKAREESISRDHADEACARPPRSRVIEVASLERSRDQLARALKHRERPIEGAIHFRRPCVQFPPDFDNTRKRMIPVFVQRESAREIDHR